MYKHLKKLATRTTAILLIVYCSSFTASSQSSDSLYCFSLQEVQHFLRTKAELEQCLESREIIIGRLEDQEQKTEKQAEALEDKNKELEKKTRKLRNNRIAAWSGGALSAVLLFFHITK